VLLQKFGDDFIPFLDLLLEGGDFLLVSVRLLLIFPVAPLKGEFAILEELLLPSVVLSRLDVEFVAEIRHRHAFEKMASNGRNFVFRLKTSFLGHRISLDFRDWKTLAPKINFQLRQYTAAKAYVADLSKSAGIRQQLDDLRAKAEGAEGIAKAKLLDKSLSLLDSELVLSSYSDTVDEIVALDPQDAAGLKSKYGELAKVAQVKEVIAGIQRSGNLDESLAKLNKVITELDLKGEALQEAMYFKGVVQYKKGDKETSKTTLEAALKLSADSKLGKQIERILGSAFK
jgi:hypothetical protein